MKVTYYRFPKDMPLADAFRAWYDVEPKEEYLEEFSRTQECNIRTAKKFLKAYGGVAFTEHYDRDGGLFETSEIHLKGNNSTVHYTHHL